MTVYKRNAQYADKKIIANSVSDLANDIREGRATPDEATTTLMGMVDKITPTKIKPVLVVALAALALIAAEKGLHYVSDKVHNHMETKHHEQWMADRGKALSNNHCRRLGNGLNHYDPNGNICVSTREEGNRQIGPSNQKTFLGRPLGPTLAEGANENDSEGYMAATAEAERIKKDELGPAVREAEIAKYNLDEHLKNVQAGERAEANGTLNERDRRIVESAKDLVKQYLPIKNAADERVKEIQRKIDAANKVAGEAEANSRTTRTTRITRTSRP